MPPHYIDLVLGQADERAGNHAEAVSALQRGRWRVPTQFPSTYLREEGRAAERSGDRVGAIRAYEHYLALRADPEPSLRADADSVRAAIARLKGGR
jgi:hypothetical protein